MLASITPLGERGRNATWAITVTAFIVGATLAGAALGALLGGLGALVVPSGFGTQARLVVLAAAVALAILLDAIPRRRSRPAPAGQRALAGRVPRLGVRARLRRSARRRRHDRGLERGHVRGDGRRVPRRAPRGGRRDRRLLRRDPRADAAGRRRGPHAQAAAGDALGVEAVAAARPLGRGRRAGRDAGGGAGWWPRDPARPRPAGGAAAGLERSRVPRRRRRRHAARRRLPAAARRRRVRRPQHRGDAGRGHVPGADRVRAGGRPDPGVGLFAGKRIPLPLDPTDFGSSRLAASSRPVRSARSTSSPRRAVRSACTR